eukprot:15157528-Alexandrium_andersonii.AAC.1
MGATGFIEKFQELYSKTTGESTAGVSHQIRPQGPLARPRVPSTSLAEVARAWCECLVYLSVLPASCASVRQ